MAYIKLDHTKVRKLMLRDRLRPADLAKMLKIPRQLTNYILHHGGVKYALELSEIFRCTREELLLSDKPRN